ncbi:4Fe-4S ferredoxin iron-sulfur binding domain protein [Methanothermus fervidus DSM 2088]|uniref:4Fe-4S ferredoxin iron-sulfur binding domain protein n=1 Tax=Methanothermus fervidus (strain ATCC 43054 / DSM 2088 / JCM 10308 / V24 S) TaxID=523846 RepID=E3GXN6_METFV|nr:4Fe-4S binding protein [Methanothermus fervidus]ADP77068.1 4Fe-4S ferredoxin iron-sulfur binding domain protein [Methanothermus fervidus DSM 2088]
MKLISVPKLCVNCKKCERICPKNAIWVIYKVPIFCLHCDPKNAPCLNICPSDAIKSINDAIVIDRDKCIGCGSCVNVCPVGAIFLDERGLAEKCDLCIDFEEPLCVKVCPTGCLRENFSDEDDIPKND